MERNDFNKKRKRTSFTRVEKNSVIEMTVGMFNMPAATESFKNRNRPCLLKNGYIEINGRMTKKPKMETMSTNDKKTAPERTAMQMMVELIEAAIFDSNRGFNKAECLKKAKELRDTVEKEQIIEARVKQIPDNWPHRTRIGDEYYNEKYTNHGKG